MAIKKKKATKKRKPFMELTLWDVILSYPDLHDPKPYKKKIYYKTDVLLGEDHPQLEELKKAVFKVKRDAFGDDKTEWPKGAKKVFIQDGNKREDQKGYKDKRYISASTQTPVPVVDLKGKVFPAQSVRGGMFANVAIRISAWEFEGDEGMSIYLQGVQVDTTKKSLNFGGGKSVEQMFKKGKSGKTGKMDDANEEDQPRGKKKKTSKKSSDTSEE